MGPKKIVAKQEVVEPEINTTEVSSNKKAPVKKVAKPKQTIKDTNNEPYDERLEQITIELNEYNNKTTALQKQLEEIENKKLNLLKKLTEMANEIKELNMNNLNDNASVINKSSTSTKSSKIKFDSSDSSEKEPSETNSDDDAEIKNKPPPKAKAKSKAAVAKSMILETGGSETKPPAKPSRAKAKAPVLNVNNDSSDNSDDE